MLGTKACTLRDSHGCQTRIRTGDQVSIQRVRAAGDGSRRQCQFRAPVGEVRDVAVVQLERAVVVPDGLIELPLLVCGVAGLLLRLGLRLELRLFS